jgi:hypothetical protein
MQMRILRHPLLHLTAAATLLTGCAGVSTTTASSDPFAEPLVMQGRLHGGQQPIAFATVKLFAAGSTGYGAAGTLYATATTANDGFGSFNFSKQANTNTPYAPTGSTWACPATGNPYMYLLAQGGNTQGTGNSATSNTASAFILGLGQCSSITTSSYYVMNEVTTVATLAALQQYFNPGTESIGAPSTAMAQTGLGNAFSLIPVMVNTTTGAALATSANTYFTGYVEAPKINTIADVLASCVNVPSLPATSCTTLFNNAAPPSPSVTSQPLTTFATATDVVQAGYYMLANPADGSNTRVNALYGLVSASPPFLPTVANAPFDWTIGITWTSSPTQLDCSTSGLTLLHSESTVITDSNGWVNITNNSSSYGGFFKMTPNGFFEGSSTYCGSTESRQSTIDPSGNTFMTLDNATTINEIRPLGNYGYVNWATPVPAYTIVSDGSGNIFYASRYNNSVYEITAATIASVPNNSSQPSGFSTLIGSVAGTPDYMSADPSGNIWIGTSAGGLFELTKSSNYTATLVPGTGSAYTVTVNQLAIESNGAVLFPYENSASSYLIGEVSGSPSAYSFTNIPGNFASNGIAVDGAGTIWSANEGSYTFNGVNSGFVTVLNSAGTELVPPYGIIKPATSSEFSSTLVQNQTVMGTSPSIAIDLSGNVWMTNSFPNMFSTALGQQYCMTEIVGAAVPVVAPFAAGLAAGTLGTKP